MTLGQGLNTYDFTQGLHHFKNGPLLALVKRMKFTLLTLILSSLGFADELSVLPKGVLKLQESQVFQGECEAKWKELAKANKPIIHALDHDAKIYLVPCANWSGANLAWSAYLSLKEPARADGRLTKAIRFVDYSNTKGVSAQDFVYLRTWNEKTMTLLSKFFLNGNENCGSQAEYSWDTNQRSFILKKLIKQDDCSMPGKPFEWVLKQETPAPR